MITHPLHRIGGFVLIASLAALLSAYVIFNPGGVSEIQPAESLARRGLPSDFALVYEWGACSENAPRQLMTINRAGAMYQLLIDSSGTTGRESTRALSQAEQQELLEVLASNEVFDLPAQILPEPNRTTLTPGCSHLEVSYDGQSKTIDEADGLDSRYYRIQLMLSLLGSGSASSAES